MNSIKTTFSIKDLENLSGIKAHTIRIWEKRYNLLQPQRTDTNIRLYDLHNLQKLLNVSFLNENGIKISHIAKLNPKQIAEKVSAIAEENDANTNTLNDFKLSMVHFDSALFHKTYGELVDKYGFEGAFSEYVLPLLNEVGILWQTDTITPAHEHFVTNLVRQKLLVEIENVKLRYPENPETTYVLFLPLHEIHEIGLMYLHYFLKKNCQHSIYLGQSVPLQNLKELLRHYKKIVFVSSFTIAPEIDDLPKYLQDLSDELLKGRENQIWISGRRINENFEGKIPDNITIFPSLVSILDSITDISNISSAAV